MFGTNASIVAQSLANIANFYNNPKNISVGFDRLARQSRRQSLYTDNQTINIIIDELLHTYEQKFNDEIVLIPLELGDFQIGVHLVCEEISEPVNYVIPFNVKGVTQTL